MSLALRVPEGYGLTGAGVIPADGDYLNTGMVLDFCLRFRFPQCPEKTAIAAPQSRLVKARQIRQGMAQALLTGRIRRVFSAITQGVFA